MTGERWQIIASAYEQAVVLDPPDRTTFLARLGTGDPALRGEVESLLAQESVTGPLDKPIWIPEGVINPPTSWSPGALIGPYRIEGVLGAGGMGEVYRARDTKLGRSVALKVLPATFAGDAERRARFQREAQVLAAINHPTIAAIYGVEDSGPTHALVLELVEGPTLAERLASGPMAVEEALGIARQIVDALDAAHDQGIIHRDLKPANIKVRADGTVKVLDFGLARLVHPETPAADPAAPTITSPATTAAGTILGTAAYMSPEQARGRPADVRSDVWAFGCILFEMLAGSRPFAGDDVVDTLAAILRTEPAWAALPVEIPPATGRLLRHCLQKDRRQRLAALADARIYLDDEGVAERVAEPPAARRARTLWLGAAGLAVSVAALVGIAVLTGSRSDRSQQPIRFTVSPPDGVLFGSPPGGGTGNGTHVAVSPDGRNMVFVGLRDGVYHLWLRPLDAPTARTIAGTEGAAFPFWSPDSRSVAFFSGTKLKKVPIDGGPVVVLCDAVGGRGGSWNTDNVIIFTGSGEVQRVSAAGGIPTAITMIDPADRETRHRWPHFLPDGQHFLYTATTGPCCPATKRGRVHIGSLNPSQSSVDLMEEESSVIYTSGYLLFARGDTLMARAFDAETRRLEGDAFPIADDLNWENGRYASVSASTDGTVAYGQGGTVVSPQLTWFDRTGAVLGTLGEPIVYENMTLSPDERHVAVALRAGVPPALNIWLYDVSNGSRRQLTTSAGDNGSPVWSPDSRHIAYENDNGGSVSLRRIDIDGQNDKVLLDARDRSRPTSWSKNGVIALETSGNQQSGWAPFPDLAALRLTGEPALQPIAQTTAAETSAAFSPDGATIAFASSDVGRGDSMVFLQPFPGPGLRTPVSKSVGSNPVWRADGRELFYVAGGGQDGLLMVVPMGANGRYEGAEPQALFHLNAPRFSTGLVYAVTRDGQRVLALGRVDAQNPAPVTVVVNWPATLIKP